MLSLASTLKRLPPTVGNYSNKKLLQVYNKSICIKKQLTIISLHIRDYVHIRVTYSLIPPPNILNVERKMANKIAIIEDNHVHSTTHIAYPHWHRRNSS